MDGGCCGRGLRSSGENQQALEEGGKITLIGGVGAGGE